MSVWSKLLEVSIPYNCYEVIHTWEPDCYTAVLTTGGRVFYEALKLYAPLYSVTYLLKKKFTLKTTFDTIHSLLTSSSFLGYYGFYLMLFYCLTRKMMGRYYFVICSYFPAFAASMLCYFVERENRRRTLAVYLANAATETALRMATARGIMKYYPNVEVYLFSVTMTSFLYITKKWGTSKNAVSSVIKFLFGEDEAKLKVGHVGRKGLPETTDQRLIEKAVSCGIQLDKKDIPALFQTIWSLKHNSCAHDSGCTIYCLQGLLRPFLLGYLALSSIRCLSARKKLLFDSSNMLTLLTEKHNFKLGLFLGGFVGTFRVINCLLRWFVGKDLPVYAIPAALLGSMFMKYFPSSTLSLYLFWKLIEFGYLSGIEAGILPHVKGFQPMLFSASTALLFHVAALEPHNLKPAFMKFLKQVTNNRILQFNRCCLDCFGTQASKMQPEFWPKLDYRYTSQSFNESVLLKVIP